VMDSGQPMMPMWLAGSWDMQTVVCKRYCKKAWFTLP